MGIQVYHVHGLFGKATDDFTDTGLIREKSTYRKFRMALVAIKIQLLNLCARNFMMH